MDNWKIVTIICIVVGYIVVVVVGELLKKNKCNGYREFLEKIFGNGEKVIDMQTDDGFDYQLLVFPDTEVSNCYKIITDGLRKYKKFNTEYQLLIERHLELEDENNKWLLEIINELSKKSRKKNDVISKMTSLDSTSFSGGIILPALFASFEKVDGLVIKGKKIKLLRFVPLYEEEIESVKKIGWEKLSKHFLGEDALGIIDETRFNYNNGRKIKIQEILNRKPGNILYDKMLDYISDKAVNNKKMNKVEKNLDYIMAFNKEFSKEGLRGYLNSKAGNDCHKMIKAFKEVSRPRLYALIYEMYVIIGGKKVPVDKTERNKYVKELYKDEKIAKSLEEWETKYSNMANVESDDRTKYIMNNKDKFKE